MKKVQMILQSERTECGLACIAMVANHYGHALTLPSLRRRFPVSTRGSDLNRLIEIAGRLGFSGRGLKLESEDLSELQTPAILHWDLNHFVVLVSLHGQKALIHDPALGMRTMVRQELEKHFTGVALELLPNASFKAEKAPRAYSPLALFRGVVGLKSALLQVLALAVVLELLTLLIPLSLQWTLDTVLLSSDVSELAVLAAALALVVLLQALTQSMRAWVVSGVGAQLSAHWSNNLFAHLMRLPMAFFERHHLGQIMQRFSSLQFIEKMLSGSFVDTLLDGLTLILLLLLLSFYSAAMTAIVLLVSLTYVGLRLFFFRGIYLREEERIAFGARQNSHIMEAVRAVMTLKLSNAEHLWAARVANNNAEIAVRRNTVERANALLVASGKLLFGWQRALLLAGCGWIAINQGFTPGMLIAFLAFADLFAVRAGALVDRVIELRMLGMHFQSIAEFAEEAPERSGEGAHVDVEPCASIEASKIGFRYSADDPWILRDLSFRIVAGESVAIVGPSGTGKTTLAKILLGLHQIEEGSLRIGGREVGDIPLAERRALFASVMQEDALLTGSIAENISLFAHDASFSAIIHAAKAAQIHDSIVAMPMGYETLIGELGSGLSGGQKQRVLLARALFRQAPMLLLDEATSHLDIATERLVNSNIAALARTRIIIAHRPETIASADRVIALAPHTPGLRQSYLANESDLLPAAHACAAAAKIAPPIPPNSTHSVSHTAIETASR
jgi:ATP-binding cassette, subfamily B, bacterial CvaB/MchF/RaxB